MRRSIVRLGNGSVIKCIKTGLGLGRERPFSSFNGKTLKKLSKPVRGKH